MVLLAEVVDPQQLSNQVRDAEPLLMCYTPSTPAGTPTPSTRRSAPGRGGSDGRGEETIKELILGVNIALGSRPVGDCSAFDRNASGEVTIDELIAAVNAALGCCS